MEERNLFKYVDSTPEVNMHAVCSVFDEILDTEDGNSYKERAMEKRIERLCNKKMHGKFFRDLGVADERSWEWISKGFVDKSVYTAV